MTSLACLALAVYFEARSEPFAGQLAVAQVVMQRVESPRYPDDVCAVVTQGPTHSNGFPVRDRCAFSFWCDGRGETMRNEEARARAYWAATITLLGYRNAELRGVWHYHAVNVTPFWTHGDAVTIGSHTFVRGVA